MWSRGLTFPADESLGRTRSAASSGRKPAAIPPRTVALSSKGERRSDRHDEGESATMEKWSMNAAMRSVAFPPGLARPTRTARPSPPGSEGRCTMIFTCGLRRRRLLGRFLNVLTVVVAVNTALCTGVVAQEAGAAGSLSAPKEARAEARTAADYLDRGLTHYNKKEYRAAIDDITAAIRLEPRVASSYAFRAQVWRVMRHRDQEIADLDAALQLDPANATYRLTRAEAWSSQGRHEEAMADFNEAVRLRPQDPTLYVARGNEWRRDLKLDLAVADYNMAIQLDPRYTHAYVCRAMVTKQRRDFPRAVAELSQILGMSPDDAEVHRALARILATCDNDEVRDGRRAVMEATRLQSDSVARSGLPRHPRRRLRRDGRVRRGGRVAEGGHRPGPSADHHAAPAGLEFRRTARRGVRRSPRLLQAAPTHARMTVPSAGRRPGSDGTGRLDADVHRAGCRDRASAAAISHVPGDRSRPAPADRPRPPAPWPCPGRGPLRASSCWPSPAGVAPAQTPGAPPAVDEHLAPTLGQAVDEVGDRGDAGFGEGRASDSVVQVFHPRPFDLCTFLRRAERLFGLAGLSEVHDPHVALLLEPLEVRLRGLVPHRDRSRDRPFDLHESLLVKFRQIAAISISTSRVLPRLLPAKTDVPGSADPRRSAIPLAACRAGIHRPAHLTRDGSAPRIPTARYSPGIHT